MQLFVNMAVKDLDRSSKFFTELGFNLFGMAQGMASVIISEQTQVMLLEEPVFGSFITKEIADSGRSTEAILCLGVENPAKVDELVDKALAAGATPRASRSRAAPLPARLRRPRRTPLGGAVPGAADRVKSETVMSDAVKSADGTLIAYDRRGAGPAVVLVQGAFSDRRHPLMTAIADGLARWFTVCNYDRRGRGGSGDVQPYAVEREIEDLAAVVEAAGGSAMVFGGSSGAALALEAAVVNPSITKLAVWEPPYHVDDSAPALPSTSPSISPTWSRWAGGARRWSGSWSRRPSCRARPSPGCGRTPRGRRWRPWRTRWPTRRRCWARATPCPPGGWPASRSRRWCSTGPTARRGWRTRGWRWRRRCPARYGGCWTTRRTTWRRRRWCPSCWSSS
ncbi:alpha/beta fold hydrolase [Nonomuraea thailandensis]